MKPLHIGLLVVGAAIAGGLAVKMTQPPAFPPSRPRVAETSKPASVPPPVAAPPVVPETPVPSSAVDDRTLVTEAAPPVYTEHAKPSPIPSQAPVKAPPSQAPVKVPPAKAAVKAAPVQIAKSTAPVPPPYVAPATQNDTIPPVQPPVPIEQQADPEPANIPPPSPQPAPAPRKVTLSVGANIPARVIQTLSSDKLKPGDTFQATLADPLIAGDLVIAERGARVTGRVIGASVAGKFQGESKLELSLTSFETSDGQRIAVSTTPWVKQGESQRNGDLAKIGGGAALGAIIGAIAGGGKGAAIGAGVGGGAGTGAVALTPSKPVTIPTETIIRFRLAAPVTITERI